MIERGPVGKIERRLCAVVIALAGTLAPVVAVADSEPPAGAADGKLEPAPPVAKPVSDPPSAGPAEEAPATFRSPTGPDIVVDIPGERTATSKIVIASGAAATAIAGALGLYWHLDSRSLSRAVSATVPGGRAWTVGDADKAERAASDRTRAAVAYSIGGALLVGTIISLILTEPRGETQVIHPHTATPTVIPAPGGAILGGMWSF